MIIAISKKMLQNDDLVILPRREYESLKASQIPTVFLKGASARRLDRRVSSTLREHKAGKSKSVFSLDHLIS